MQQSMMSAPAFAAASCVATADPACICQHTPHRPQCWGQYKNTYQSLKNSCQGCKDMACSRTRAHEHPPACLLSLSLSLSHTHTHTHRERERGRQRATYMETHMPQGHRHLPSIRPPKRTLKSSAGRTVSWVCTWMTVSGNSLRRVPTKISAARGFSRPAMSLMANACTP
jgi:hypothetical protein